MQHEAHRSQIRVRYGEVDRMDVAYHAHYLVWFEQGRTEYLRAKMSTYRALEESGLLLLVVESGVRHLRPAHYDDLLEVRTTLAEASGVRLRFVYEVWREETLLATGFTVLAGADRNGKPQRLPAAIRALLGPPPPPAAVLAGPKAPVASKDSPPEGSCR